MIQNDAINNPYYVAMPEGGGPVMVPTFVDKGEYVGELDFDHLRTGVGSCRWADNSTYEGDWFKDVRHGNGRYVTMEGDVFEGAWVNDKKHGPGRLTYANGDVIESTWINDRLNGLALVSKKGEEPETVIFKEDMKIMANDSGVSCCDIVYIVWSIILMLACYAAIPLGALVTDEMFGLFICYIIYQIISCCHYTTKFLSNLISI